MVESPRPTLLVFLKYPEAGRVKTRLAEEIGATAAAELYRDWIGIVLQNIQPVRPTVHVVGYFAGADVWQFATWNALVDAWRPQPEGSLGDRLAAGFAWAHSRGGSVIAIGTDCLDLAAEHIARSANLLGEADVVLGPATDGGYYLVASQRLVPNLFVNVRWSSPRTLNDQRRQCDRLGLRVALLAELADIDTLDDWLAYRDRRGEMP
jgi:hypothetical protein